MKATDKNKDSETGGQSFFVKTFGCQMNEYDSERISLMLRAEGFQQASSYAEASIIILNTCTVRKKAEDKAYSELGRLKLLKKKNPLLLIAVGGCLAQQEGHALIKRYPYTDVVFGTKALSRLPFMLKQALKEKKTVDISMSNTDSLYPTGCRTATDTSVSSFVTIMEGCNNFCSYCIVPYVRGREWSRPPEDIIREVTHLVACGTREVTLLGQNVNYYGVSLRQKMTFDVLLLRVCAVEGLERIRFTTSHPKDLTDALIRVFKDEEKLCDHINLPLQSG